jgi:hypothetical protein
VGGHDVCNNGPCPCGWDLTRQQRTARAATLHRSHAFWHCPVAQAVVEQLQHSIQQPVQRHHLWLVCSPTTRVQPMVWQIACLAALSAMDSGRRALWRGYIAAGGRGVAPLGNGTQQVHTAIDYAVASVWLLLANFASRPQIPSGWDAVDSSHPFISVIRLATGPSLQVNLPANVNLAIGDDVLNDTE